MDERAQRLQASKLGTEFYELTRALHGRGPAQRAHFGRSVGSRGDKKPPRLVVDKGGLGGNPRHIKCMWHDIPRHTEILSPLQC